MKKCGSEGNVTAHHMQAILSAHNCFVINEILDNGIIALRNNTTTIGLINNFYSYWNAWWKLSARKRKVYFCVKNPRLGAKESHRSHRTMCTISRWMQWKITKAERNENKFNKHETWRLCDGKQESARGRRRPEGAFKEDNNEWCATPAEK